MIHLDFRDARPIYSQILSDYKTQIAAGILVPGEKLPSVRELAGQLAINPNTIQRAYRELEGEGWIVSVPGKGSFVAAPPSAQPGEVEQQLEAFDRIVTDLLSRGISPRQLQDRIAQGGNFHA